jgi:hypothetical protein
MSKTYIKITKDFTKQFNDIIGKFKHEAVLVGIPESKGTREDGPISNAALLAINNFGSPELNIPAWPIMSIGIRAAQKDIADQFKLAAQNALKRGISAIDQYYDRVGIIGSNAIKQVIGDQTDAPVLADSTLRARMYAGFKGDKRLLVTSQLRNAITFVRIGAA